MTCPQIIEELHSNTPRHTITMMFQSICTVSITLFSIASAISQAPPNPAWKPAASNLIVAQQMVYDLLGNHPDLKVVGIHGRAPGAGNSTVGTILAINMDRIGKLDDVVDDEVAFNHKVVLEPNIKKSEY